MVTFELIENTEILKYHYWPEGNKDHRPGLIVADLQNDDISIETLAENDWERMIPVEEINIMIEDINRMRAERGEEAMELATEPERCVFYGDRAVNEIVKSLRKGEIPEQGSQAWY
ncbi:MAG: hypothetical protein IKE74_09150 [Mogibacterium sp.]|nr:hypothetical protein [Mogibacterium sp.]